MPVKGLDTSIKGNVCGQLSSEAFLHLPTNCTREIPGMIIDEMVEHYRKLGNFTQAEVNRVLEESSIELAKVWHQMRPSSPEGINHFYTSTDYTAELLNYHQQQSRRDADLDIMIEVRGKNRAARVLDYGCGTGVIGFMLKDTMPALTVDLFDLSSPAFDFAKGFNVHRKRPVEFVNTFDIQHNTYDFIICNDVLEHLPDAELEETIDLLQKRLARPFGRIFGQIGFYEPHIFPMHFDWTEERCNILRRTMRWEFWDINLDFLNLVMKGKLSGNGTGAVIGTTGRKAGSSHSEKQCSKEVKIAPSPSQSVKPAGSSADQAGKIFPSIDHSKNPGVNLSSSAASPPPAAPRQTASSGRTQETRSERRVSITRKGVLYVGFPCNIKCKFCYYSYNESKEWHPLDECKRDASLFKEKYGNQFVDITGGEPTIYPHIYELLDFCNKIDLKPTLITNVQALAKDERVKQFKDHGVYDFLCSVHALDDTYNSIIQSRHGWKNLTEGIENINKYDIPWRANCTMTRLNMDQLKSIAQWVKDRNARIINFINFNPFEEWRTKMDIDFQARHSEIGPCLVEALEHCDRIGLEANVRYFPFCHMRGHEEKCINFQQLSYDPNEWDFCSWYAPETRAPSDKLPDSVRTAVTNEEELHHFVAQSQKKGLYVQNGPCLSCSHMVICDGFTKQYYSRFGIEEASPFAGPPLNDPAVFLCQREGSVFLRPKV